MNSWLYEMFKVSKMVLYKNPKLSLWDKEAGPGRAHRTKQQQPRNKKFGVSVDSVP